MKGFGCHRKGHVPADGWDDEVRMNKAGRAFVTHMCRNCHCPFIEYVLGVQMSTLVDAKGAGMLKEAEERA